MPSCRQRTTSFNTPRTMLQRTESFLSLSDFNDDAESGSFLHMSPSLPPSPRPNPLTRTRTRTLYSHPQPKLGRKRAQFTIAPSPPSCPPKQFQLHLRTTSPLAPTRKLLPPRASFPRSKPEPDLYRMALKGRMRSSPEGEKILCMGPRLAIAILSATRELERIVSAHEDDDVTMGDETEPAHVPRWREMVAVPCGA